MGNNTRAFPEGNARLAAAVIAVEKERLVQVIMKGYGDVKLAGSGELVPGEITLHAEGWVAVAPIPPSDEGELRWFPSQQVAEVIWRKNLAVRPPRPPRSA